MSEINRNEKSLNLKSLISLSVLANLNKKHLDVEHAVHSFGIEREVTEVDLVRIAKSVGLKVKIKSYKIEDYDKIPLPSMAENQEGDYIVVAQRREDGFLLFDPLENKPVLHSFEEFEMKFSGKFFLAVDRSFINRNVKFGLKWFLPSIVKFKKSFGEVLIGALAIQLLGLGSPMVTQVIVDKVLMHKSFSTLNVLMVGLIIIASFEMFLSIAKNYVFTHTTNRIDVILNARLFQHLFRLPLNYFESRRAGDTIARVREIENIRRFLTGAPLSSILDVTFIVVYLVVMWIYSATLTKIIIMILPVFIILSITVTPIIKYRLKEKFNAGADVQAFLVESISGIQTIKSFALEPLSQRKWEDKISKYTEESFKTSWVSGTAGSIGQFIQRTMDIIILWVGAHLVMSHDISVGQLIAFRMLSGRVSGPILRIVQMWQEFQQTSVSLERLGDIFDAKPEPSTDGKNLKMPKIMGNISFEDIVFRYKVDGPEIIKNLSVNIKAGTTVGIVGRSGSGKSTLAKLIQRLYIPERGKILIDGVDISMTDPAWIRRQIGVVLQENFLFNGSIKDNISIHHPIATMEEIINVAKIAGAHDFILELQGGYESQVGENGVALSGGQKQRIAIARALLTNPKILIFDEATSALDYESERIIQKNLEQICRGRTVLIIAHRLSTIQMADGIIVMDNGKIVEMGNHENLVKRKGLYNYLFNQQFGGVEE